MLMHGREAGVWESIHPMSVGFPFPPWNKWQTAAFPFLPVFRLLIDALCLPHYSSFSQFVETDSFADISHIWRASLIALVFRGVCFDDLHLLLPPSSLHLIDPMM